MRRKTDISNVLPATHTGYVIGYRRWTVLFTDIGRDKKPHLYSIAYTQLWLPFTPMKAEVPLAGGIGMDSGSYISCGYSETHLGVYAFRSYWMALGYRSYHRSVIGRVALWGETAFHHKGFRAQYAYPISIMEVRGNFKVWEKEAMKRQLAKAYGCLVEEAEMDDRFVKWRTP